MHLENHRKISKPSGITVTLLAGSLGGGTVNCCPYKGNETNLFHYGTTADEIETPEAISSEMTNKFPRKQSLNVVLKYPCLICAFLKEVVALVLTILIKVLIRSSARVS